MADNSLIFAVEKPCPVCGEMTHITKTKSRLIVLQTDCDFCTHYKDFNPYFYTPWVCEKCGYAADEKHFTTPMPSGQKQKLLDFLTKRKVNFKFNLERKLPDAVAAYKLAIFYEEMLQTSLAYRAGLYLKLAWVYRIAEDKESEKSYLIRAAECYSKSVMTERYPVGSLTDSTALYLTGAIYYLLNDIDNATQYVSRLMSDSTLKSSDPQIYDRVRNLWTDIREVKEKEEAKAKAANKGAKGTANPAAKKN